MYWRDKTYFGVDVLLGETLVSIDRDELEGGDRLIFTTEKGEKYEMSHDQDCCESVYIKEMPNDISDIIGSPLTMAEESSNSEDEKRDPENDYWDESHTWTFYKFATKKGYVTITWYGSSNGYYSESVGFYQVK